LNAPAPVFEKFLDEIFESKRELMDYIQRLLGYAISAEVLERIFVIFYGPHGQNGKGTLVEALRYVLGLLAGPIESEMLLAQRFSRPSGSPASDLMYLRGKRLVWASETGEGRTLDAGKVKWLSGGDTIVGRSPYGKEEVAFAPTHTLILLTNYRPRAGSTDHALWSRIHLVPFSLSFVDDPKQPYERKRDVKLLHKLRAEAPGILAWLVRGCLLWREQGLNPPAIVKEATKHYRDEEDIIGSFIKERCTLEPHAEVQAGKLYEAYKSWAEHAGLHAFNQKQFGKDVRDRFDSYENSHSGRTYYLGLELREGLR
jgi:putative DNA primase/helicase